ncbi:MAG: 50S ribosomal protein L32 [Candidatus Obscuribacterales bacterium]|nr:50S ribosomal protein L32 [Candidatus Obscuribacterales bacterium]
MPQPKKKTSHQKQAQRRANWKLELVATNNCANCGSPKLPHIACSGCGYYRGRPVRRRDWLVNS